MLIKEAGINDLGEVLALLGEMDKEEGLTLDEAKKIWNIKSVYPYYKIFLVTDENRAIGTFSLIIIDNLGHKGAKLAVVENVIVSSKVRGNGVGTFMMNSAMEMAAREKCYKLMLSSNKNRILAHKFYKNIGFKQHGISFAMDVRQEV